MAGSLKDKLVGVVVSLPTFCDEDHNLLLDRQRKHIRWLIDHGLQRVTVQRKHMRVFGCAQCGRMILTIDTPEDEAARIGEEAKSRGLGIISLYGGSFSLKKSVSDGIAGLKRLINNSSSCGSPNIFFPGPDSAEIVDDFCKVIAECCDYAAEKGVRINVKPRAPLYTTGRQCRSLIEKVGHKNFNLWYDPGNVYLYSEGKINPVEDAAEVEDLVAGLSIKDFITPDRINVTPGTGEVDFAGLIDRLNRGGFSRGPMIVESLSEGDLAHINNEARKARIFVEELMK